MLFIRKFKALFIKCFAFQCLLLPILAHAQLTPMMVTPPTAASMVKYGDIPVNFHTGIPEINIPIYTIREGSLALPISLSYHASGLRVMEQASWVGSGWTLQAGGVITRTTRGNTDERTSSGKSYLKDKGYYSYLFANADNTGSLDFYQFAQGNKDGEPDLFFFNFNGYSGKFQFRPDGSVSTFPEQGILVKPLFCEGLPSSSCNSSHEYLYGFVATTPNGDRYFFGKTIDNATDVDPVEKTQTYTNTSGLSTTTSFSSWYLYRVESGDRRYQINLTYASENYSFFNVSTFPIPSTAGGSALQLVRTKVLGVRLNQIAFSNGAVTFNALHVREDVSDFASSDYGDGTNAQAAALTQIHINAGSLCKKFDFSYSYFACIPIPLQGHYGTYISNLESTYNIRSDKKRLKLNSVQEISCDNSILLPKHIFTYYDETNVPRALSLAQDHWGYYNGALLNNELTPPLSHDGGVTFTVGGNANRDSSWPEMRAGSLQKITYPTGGTTEFTYGYHRIYVAGNEKKVGGLRIEGITHRPDPVAVPIVKTYDYQDFPGEQGVLFSRPSYISLVRNDMMQSSGVATGGSGGGYTGYASNGCLPSGSLFLYFRSAGSIFPLATTQGYHFGYRKVKEISSDGSSSVFEYQSENNVPGDVCNRVINQNQCDLTAPNFPPAPEPYNFIRGSLIRSSHYTAAGNLVKQTHVTTEYTAEPTGLHGLIVRSHGSWLPATEYNLKSAKKTRETVIELEFDAENPNLTPKGIWKESLFAGANHTFETKETVKEVTAWNGATATLGVMLHETRKTYVSDVLIPACISPSDCDAALAANMATALTTYNNADKSTFSNRYIAWQDYMVAVNGHRMIYVNCRSVNLTNYGSNCEAGSGVYSTASAELKAILDLKINGMLDQVLEISQWRDNSFLSSGYTTYSIWEGNRNLVYPVAFDLLSTAIPRSSTYFTSVSNSATAITKDGKYINEASYTFKSGNLSEITGKDGVKTSYLWGHGNRFLIAKVTGAASNQVYYEGFESSGTVGSARTGSRFRNSGTFTIPFPPPDGQSYRMSYWYLSGGTWTFSGELPFNANISQGTGLDEIRVYLAGSLMTTYTYEEGNGVSSITDAGNRSIFYTYDQLGRLRLTKDHNGNIMKETRYNYRTAATIP